MGAACVATRRRTVPRTHRVASTRPHATRTLGSTGTTTALPSTAIVAQSARQPVIMVARIHRLAKRMTGNGATLIVPPRRTQIRFAAHWSATRLAGCGRMATVPSVCQIDKAWMVAARSGARTFPWLIGSVLHMTMRIAIASCAASRTACTAIATRSSVFRRRKRRM